MRAVEQIDASLRRDRPTADKVTPSRRSPGLDFGPVTLTRGSDSGADRSSGERFRTFFISRLNGSLCPLAVLPAVSRPASPLRFLTSGAFASVFKYSIVTLLPEGSRP
jgi:hypothetical protein